MSEITDTELEMRSYLKRIATGPELSKDLSLEEAESGMTLILEGKADPVQAAVFLVALRMKRETEEENQGVYNALQKACLKAPVNCNNLIHLAEPFNGYNRHLPSTPFLAALLAACGLPTVLYGCPALAPKFGATHKMILGEAGKNTELSVADAATKLQDSSVGWAYMDQSVYCPGLWALHELRRLIFKRPCLSTLEKIISPFDNSQASHLVVGYVHRAYPELLLNMATYAGFQSCLLVRGFEGGILPSLNGKSKFYSQFNGAEVIESNVDPQLAGISSEHRSIPLLEKGQAIESIVDCAKKEGLAALNGEDGETLKSLILTASLIFSHVKAIELSEAAEEVRDAIHSGKALDHFKAF